MNSSLCPVCKSPLFSMEEATLKKSFNCPRCGQFIINVDVEVILGGEYRRGILWAITSHAIRSMQAPRGGPPYRITQEWLTSVWASQKLPNPQMQADRFVEYLGEAGAPGEWVGCVPHEMTGLLGTIDDPSQGQTGGFTYIIERLKSKGLIEQHRYPSDGRKAGFRLTFDGWERFEELHRVSAESRIAFMAMGYENPVVDRTFAEFVRAVRQTGFQLSRLDQKPKAGLIDLRMRIEIRSAKFLIADLTEENRGAYWEAGFAEGLGKKVYYSCEESKFEATKSHFDTEHLFTIKWSLDRMAHALDELKSAIRNDFPTEANQLDETN